MNQTGMVMEIEPISLNCNVHTPIEGLQALKAIIQQAESYTATLQANDKHSPKAILGRVRGTGPGVSFGSLVDAIRSAFPVEMESPFEGSSNVAGGVLLPAEAGIHDRNDGLLFLRFGANTTDLPMHTHEHSDRFIYVLEGRGFFHVTHENVSEFDGHKVRHVPVRSRDVLLFKRGTVHTFSTGAEPMLLLSYHSPLISLTDPRQYKLPNRAILPPEIIDTSRSRITCDPAWSCLI